MPLRGNRQRAVLALLSVRANEWTHRDVVIHELWADDPPRTARNSIQRFGSELLGTSAQAAQQRYGAVIEAG